MSAVGGITVKFLRGSVPAMIRQRVEHFQVPGIDGVGAQLLGKGGQGSQLRVVWFDTLAGIIAWGAAVQGLQGATVTIVNDFGTSFTNQLILTVSELVQSAAWHAENLGTDGVRGELVLNVVRTN